MILRHARQTDWPIIEDLLRRYALPVEGAHAHADGFVVAEADGQVVGVGGLEVYAGAGLLRSVAVAEPRTGVGRALVEHLLADARRRGLTEVALLTTSAVAYFLRFGFEQVGWDDVDPALHQSTQFQGACPSTAVAMRVRLAPGGSG